jgi:hypothetical protein
MVADVLHAFSSSSSLEESVTDVTVTSLVNRCRHNWRRECTLAHPAMGDPFDVIPYDVRPISSADQLTHNSNRAGY